MQSLKALASSYMGDLLSCLHISLHSLNEWSALLKASTYMTTQHRQMRTNFHALSGIWNHDLRVGAIKDHASDRSATVTDKHEQRNSEK